VLVSCDELEGKVSIKRACKVQKNYRG